MMNAAKKHTKSDEGQEAPEHNQVEVEALREQVQQLEETVKRVQADYHNMMRRHQEQSQKQARMAGAGVVRALVQPLSHLELAAKQINDQGLTMVVQQLWQNLNGEGLETVGKVGDEFNPLTMEAISQQGEGTKVVAVSQPGYVIYGEVIQPAKVVVGSMTASK